VSTVILSPKDQITKWLVAIDPTTDLTGQPDNVYPFAGGIDGDQWAVVIGETQTAWSSEYGVACLIYAEFDGIAPTTESDADDYGLAEATLSPRGTGRAL
jgi:hypothetical protein